LREESHLLGWSNLENRLEAQLRTHGLSFMAHAIALPDVSEVIRVLAADATRMNSQLLAAALERDKRFQVLDPVSDGRGIIAAVVKEKPAVVVISAELDEDKRKGFEVARELRASHPETRVVMLIDTSEHSHVVEAFRAGARGVFCRSESLMSLAKCIQCVSEGQIWANSRELRYLLEALGEALPLRVIDARGAALLSRRELEVVRCVAEGLSNREIAQRLGLTEHTVKNYLFRIFDKLGVSKRVEVVLYAYSLGGLAEVAGPGAGANGKKLPAISGTSPTLSQFPSPAVPRLAKA
jgi:two-component system nitrate/nitrite response regulator NarL